uniref:Uncharacterized protein n=1 Tax=Arundo donax TaxID=35708 RepID=A0A0A8Y9X6_ARUDO
MVQDCRLWLLYQIILLLAWVSQRYPTCQLNCRGMSPCNGMNMCPSNYALISDQAIGILNVWTKL